MRKHAVLHVVVAMATLFAARGLRAEEAKPAGVERALGEFARHAAAGDMRSALAAIEESLNASGQNRLTTRRSLEAIVRLLAKRQRLIRDAMSEKIGDDVVIVTTSGKKAGKLADVDRSGIKLRVSIVVRGRRAGEMTRRVKWSEFAASEMNRLASATQWSGNDANGVAARALLMYIEGPKATALEELKKAGGHPLVKLMAPAPQVEGRGATSKAAPPEPTPEPTAEERARMAALVKKLEIGGQVAYMAARKLGVFGPKAAEYLPALVETLKKAKDVAEWPYVSAISQIGPAAVPHLVPLLRDKRPHVRRVAAQSLGEIGLPAKIAIKELARLFGDPDQNVVACAWFALGKIGEPAVSALVGVLRHKDSMRRSKALFALRDIGPEAAKAVPAILGILKRCMATGKQRVATKELRCCLDTLTAIGSKARPALPYLNRIMQTGDADLQLIATIAIAAVSPGDRKAMKSLRGILADPKHRYVSKVLRAMRVLGASAKDALPELIGLLDTDNRWRQQDVVRALGAMGSEAKMAVPKLIELLEHRDPKDKSDEVPMAAAEALGEIGPAASDAIPALKRIAKNGPRHLRTVATEALDRIQGQQ